MLIFAVSYSIFRRFRAMQSYWRDQGDNIHKQKEAVLPILSTNCWFLSWVEMVSSVFFIFYFVSCSDLFPHLIFNFCFPNFLSSSCATPVSLFACSARSRCYSLVLVAYRLKIAASFLWHDGRLRQLSCLSLKPLVSHLRYVSQVKQKWSQHLYPDDYRPSKVIQGNTITLAHSDEPYMQRNKKFMESRFHELDHESKMRLLKTQLPHLWMARLRSRQGT